MTSWRGSWSTNHIRNAGGRQIPMSSFDSLTAHHKHAATCTSWFRDRVRTIKGCKPIRLINEWWFNSDGFSHHLPLPSGRERLMKVTTDGVSLYNAAKAVRAASWIWGHHEDKWTFKSCLIIQITLKSLFLMNSYKFRISQPPPRLGPLILTSGFSHPRFPLFSLDRSVGGSHWITASLKRWLLMQFPIVHIIDREICVELAKSSGSQISREDTYAGWISTRLRVSMTMNRPQKFPPMHSKPLLWDHPLAQPVNPIRKDPRHQPAP